MKAKKAVKLIFNPNAGAPGGNPSALLERIVTKLVDLGLKVNVTLAPRKKAAAAARRAVKDGYQTVIAVGGDGTIEAVASGLVGTKARLGIIPVGTYNNVAKSLGVPEDLDAACELVKKHPKRRVDVGQVNGPNGKLYFMEEIGVGLTADIFPEVKDVHKLNLEKVTNAVKTFVSFQPPHFTLNLDGESVVESDTLVVTVFNSPAYGVNFLEAPEASVEDGLLEVRLYPGFSKAELVQYFASIMNGKTVADTRVQRYRARKVKIKADPPQEAVADNISLGRGTVKARVLRKALRVIAPKGEGLAQPAAPKSEQIPAPAVPAAPDIQQQKQDEQAEKLSYKNSL